MDGGGSGELSDGSSSGYWSVGHANGSPAPSPPMAGLAASPATPPDEGLDMEMEQVLFDEPSPRKRRVSSGCDTMQWAPQWSASTDAVFPPAELGEGNLQVSVAQLWEGAHVGGGNQTSHPDDAPVVRHL